MNTRFSRCGVCVVVTLVSFGTGCPRPGVEDTSGGTTSTTTVGGGGTTSTTTTQGGGGSTATTTQSGGGSTATTTQGGGGSTSTTQGGGGSTTTQGGGGSTSTTTQGGGGSTSTTQGGGGSMSTTAQGGGGTGGGGECSPGAMMSCYDGPPGTLGVGPCASGMKTCDPFGFWGSCAGQVFPAYDACNTPVDEDCDSMTPGCHVWSKRFGGAPFEGAYDVAVDAAGNVFVTGYSNGAIDFGPPCAPLVNNGGGDIFLAKLDVGGTCVWAQGFGGTGDDYGMSVAVDASNDVLLTGFSAGSVNFGGGSLPFAGGANDLYVTKFSGANGAHVWSQMFGGAEDDRAYGIAVDPSKAAYVVGRFNGNVDFGGGVLPGGAGAKHDIVVLKLDQQGNHVWSKAISESSCNMANTLYDCPTAPLAITTYMSSTLVTGTASANVDCPGATVMNIGAGTLDVLYLSLDATTGTCQSGLLAGDAPEQRGRAIAADANGVTLAGDFNGKIDFGLGQPPIPANPATDDAFLVRFMANAPTSWAKPFGDAAAQIGYGVAHDGDGNLLLIGSLQGAVNFGGGPLSSAGSNDVYLAKLDPLGNHLYSDRFGDAGSQNGFSLAVDPSGAGPSGDVIVVGSFSGAIDFGGGPLTSAGSTDLFVARLRP